MATPERRLPRWARPAIAVTGVLLAFAVGLAAVRLPGRDSAVWVESSLVAGSAVALAGVAWLLAGARDTVDQRVVLRWGLGSGFVLGALWMAEIAFNNLTPRTVSTPAARGALDNTVWAIIGAVTVVVAGVVAARTRRWRSGLRAGLWSGVGSGLGAALGGAVLLAAFRASVEGDPLMLAEWRERGRGVDLAVYVTRETMAGVGAHLWVLGVVQGALLGVVGSSAVAAAIRFRAAARGRRSGGVGTPEAQEERHRDDRGP